MKISPKIPRRIVPILQLMTSITLIISLLINTWLPNWILGVGLIMSAVFAFFSFTGIKFGIKVIQLGLSVVIALSLIYAQQSLSLLLNNSKMETTIFNFYVTRDSSIVTLEETTDLSFGISDQVENDVRTRLSKNLESMNTRANWETSLSEQELFTQLVNGEIDVWVVDASFLEALVEWDPELMSKVTLIFSTEESFVKPEITKDVNTSKETFVIFLSGIDTSGPIHARSRSDVNILLVVNPNSYEVLTVSIPRDAYIDLACKSNAKDKLTHAGVYGVDCSVSTIEQLFDIDINYYVKVNFASFLKVVDVVGPIKVYSQYTFTTTKYVSYYRSYTFNAGINLMNAEQALFFSRERHAFVNSDVQRGLNQQQVIKGIISKLIEPSTLMKIDRIIKTTASAIDTNLTKTELYDLIKLQLEKNPAWSFSSNYLRGTSDYQPTYSMGSRKLFVYWPDAASVSEIHNQIEMIKSHSKPEIDN